MPATPLPASTVILLRDGPAGPTVLLVMRRKHGSDPFSGASVFPGGVVEDADADPDLAPAPGRDGRLPALRPFDDDLPAAALRSSYVAACRELFEEAAVLLARDHEGVYPSSATLRALHGERTRLQSGEARFHSVLAARGLRLALDELEPYAHVVTPEVHPRRWDTRFFLAAAPPGQEASCDGAETCEAVWVRPAEALDAYRAGEHVLAPPTVRVLEGLGRFSSAAEALEAARRAGPPPMLLPAALADAPVPTLVYPGDRDYPGASGRDWDRLVLENGRWKSVRSGGE